MAARLLPRSRVRLARAIGLAEYWDALARLVEEWSVKEPVVAEPRGEGYVVVEGEETFAALDALGVAEVPAVLPGRGAGSWVGIA